MHHVLHHPMVSGDNQGSSVFQGIMLCRLKELEGGYTYQGEQTCAADGMCQVKCPVGINTGELIKSIRADELDASDKSYGFGISKVPLPPLYLPVFSIHLKSFHTSEVIYSLQNLKFFASRITNSEPSRINPKILLQIFTIFADIFGSVESN